MYTLYKITRDGIRNVVAYCESCIDGAQAIEADKQTFDDNASYELIKEGADDGNN